MDKLDLQNRFTYHPPTGLQVDTYNDIRTMALNFANILNDLCPDSREKSLAITKLEEVIFWANASIARNS
jgi:hypothetical protein